MADLFDDLTRILGSRMSRREAARLVTGGLAARYLARGLAGGVLGVLWPGRAEAAYAASVCDAVFTGPTCDPTLSCNCPPGSFCCTTSGVTAALHRCCVVGDECCGSARGGGALGAPTCCQPALGEICCGPGPGGHFRCCNLNKQCCCSVPGHGGRAVRCKSRPRFTVIARPPNQIKIEVTDPAGDGLTSIRVVTAENASVDIPDFSPGDNAVIVTGTKIDPEEPSRIVLEACAICGEAGACCGVGDPVVTTLRVPEGKDRIRESFAGIPAAEHFLLVQNGRRGLYRLRVLVNGKAFGNLYLDRKEVRAIDMAHAMTEPQNVITLVGHGAPGSSALILISDVPIDPSASKSLVGLPYVAWDEESAWPEADPSWGRKSLSLEN